MKYWNYRKSKKTTIFWHNICIYQNKVVPLQHKGLNNLILETMFGVKSSNKPISGQFAEEFCKHLMEMKEQTNQDATEMLHNIICD